jgi:hypothetical protein
MVGSGQPFHTVGADAHFCAQRANLRGSRRAYAMTRDELLARLGGLRPARVGQVRVPHKPLLLLWLFGQFAATGSSVASYRQAEEPVSQLINDFGPPVASPAAGRQRAAMPFVHLERELWVLRDAAGREIASDAPERPRHVHHLASPAGLQGRHAACRINHVLPACLSVHGSVINGNADS